MHCDPVSVPGWSGPDRRATPRHTTIHRAWAVLDDDLIDCVVLNLSPGGALVHVGGARPLPERFELHVQNGTRHAARRRWAAGQASGLGFSGGPQLSDAGLVALSQAYDGVRATTLQEVLDPVQRLDYLDSPGLRAAAETAEAAIRTLEARLAACLRTGSVTAPVGAA